MKSLIIYESMYGNTRKIAESIAKGIGSADVGSAETSGASTAVVEVVPASHASEFDLAPYDLVVVGGPTHIHGLSRQRTRQGAIDAAGQPGATLQLDPAASGTGIREWLSTLDAVDSCAAAFDTRLDRSPLITGRASKTIAKLLQKLGCTLIVGPESFLVDASTTLKQGEVVRAEEWGRTLVAVNTSPKT